MKYRTKIISDPAEAPPHGTRLEFQSVLAIHPSTESAAYLKTSSSTHGILLSMFFGDEFEHTVDGSAVLVAPGIALCAQHVVMPQIEAVMKSLRWVMCVGFTEKGVQLWAVRQATIIPESDLVILRLAACSALLSDWCYKLASITTRFPMEGETLQVAGYRASEPSFPKKPGSWGRTKGTVFVCNGKVTQRYPNGRDRIMLPGPCVELDCPSWGGMSGGPVFDQYGWLIGLLSTSVSGDDDTGPSFVSLLWPALTAEFEGGWPEAIFRGKRCLLNWDKFCRVQGREAIKVRHDLSNNLVHREWLLWESESQLPSELNKTENAATN